LIFGHLCKVRDNYRFKVLKSVMKTNKFSSSVCVRKYKRSYRICLSFTLCRDVIPCIK